MSVCTEQVFLRSGASESLQRLLLVDAPSLHGDAALSLEIVKKPELHLCFKVIRIGCPSTHNIFTKIGLSSIAFDELPY